MSLLLPIITLVVASAEAIIIYQLIRNADGFMPKPFRIILLIAFSITFYMMAHDYMYDKPSVPYTLTQYIQEAVLFGGFVTGILFAVFSGVYLFFKMLVEYTKRLFTKRLQ